MFGLFFFFYAGYALVRCVFHSLLGGLLSRLTGSNVGGEKTGCWYFVKFLIALALVGFFGLAEL